MSDRAPPDAWHEQKCREAKERGIPMPADLEYRRHRVGSRLVTGYFRVNHDDDGEPLDWDARYTEHMRRVSERIRIVCGEEVRRAG